MKTQQFSLAKAAAIRQALLDLGIAYGTNIFSVAGAESKPRLYRIAPSWYTLWPEQWQEIKDFGGLLPELLRTMDNWDGTATYVRADFIVGAKGRLQLTEAGLTPVWDYFAEMSRRIYHEILGLPEDCFDPFPGGATAIRSAIKSLIGNRRLVILVGPHRLSYSGDYRATGNYFGQGGSRGVVITNQASLLQSGDLVYRTFTEWEMGHYYPLQALANRITKGEISVWPAFSQLESKLWLADVFTDGQRWSRGELKKIRPFIPWTWPVDPKQPPQYEGRTLRWATEELIGREPKGLVLKPINGGQGRDIAFSRDLAPADWRAWVLQELLAAAENGKPRSILQREINALDQKMTFLEPDGHELVSGNGFRTRLCVAYIVEGDKATPVDAEATLRANRLVHGASDAINLPVVVRTVIPASEPESRKDG